MAAKTKSKEDEEARRTIKEKNSEKKTRAKIGKINNGRVGFICLTYWLKYLSDFLVVGHTQQAST